MRHKATLLTGLVAIAIVVGSGYVHGLWSFRWSATAEVKNAVANLGRVPMAFGDWKGEETTLEERQMKIGKLDGALTRVYTNTKTGQKISFLVVCGRPGPLSVHTPDVCYGGSGYASVGDRQRLSVDYGADRPAEFVAIVMKKPDPVKPSTLAIDFGWFAGNKWTGPIGDARFTFAGFPVLYKMYVIREQGGAGERNDFDPNAEFLRAILPELQRVLGTSVS